MAEYTMAQYLEMYHCYVLSDEDIHAAANMYRERNGNAERFPDYRVIRNLVDRMRNTGSVLPNHAHGRPRVEEDEILEMLVLRAFRDDQRLSLRKCAARF